MQRILLGLAAGLILGAVLTCAYLLWKEPPAQAPDLSRIDLEVRNRTLQERITRLERDLAEARAKTVAAAPPPVPVATPGPEPSPVTTPAPPTPAELRKDFTDMAEAGIMAYRGKKFNAMVEKLKAAGADALAILGPLLLESEATSDRFLAAALLEELKDPAGLALIAESCLKETDDLVRRMSVHAAAIIGGEGAEAILRGATNDKDWGVRANASYGIAKLGHEDGVTALLTLYGSPEMPAEYRLAVLGGLSDVAAPSTASFFRRILQESKDSSYLLMSIQALTKMGDKGSIGDLQRMLSSDLPASVKQAVEKAIAKLSS